MLMLGEETIRDVIAFRKTRRHSAWYQEHRDRQRGRLDELGIELEKQE